MGRYNARSGVPSFINLFLRDLCGNIPKTWGDKPFKEHEESLIDVKLYRLPHSEWQHHALGDGSLPQYFDKNLL
jgi:hypothetical protein